METLFPFDHNWHWPTFFLYVISAMLISKLCLLGGKLGQRYKNGTSIYTTDGRRTGKFFYTIAWLILVLLAGLRTKEVGPDTYTYVSIFESVKTYNDVIAYLEFGRWEPGYVFLLFIIRQFTSNYTVFLLIVYSIVAYGYIRFIKEFYKADSDFVFLQVFIFYYVNNMSAMRSAIACAFFFLSLISLCKNKYLKAVVLALCATAFHYTMIYSLYVIFALKILNSTKLKEKRAVWIICLLIITLATNFGLSIIQSLMVGTRYDYYTRSAAEERSLLGSIFVIAYAFLCIKYLKVLRKRELKDYPDLNNVLLVTLLFMMTYPVIYFLGAYRITYYYALPRITIWSRITNIIRKKWMHNNRLLFSILEQIVIVLYLLFLFTRFSNAGNFVYYWRF